MLIARPHRPPRPLFSSIHHHVFLNVAASAQTGSIACAIPATTSTAAAASATNTTAAAIPTGLPTSRATTIARKRIAVRRPTSSKKAAPFAKPSIASATLPEQRLPCAAVKSTRRQQLWQPVRAFSHTCPVAVLAEQLCSFASDLFQHTAALPSSANGMAVCANHSGASGATRTATKHRLTTA